MGLLTVPKHLHPDFRNINQKPIHPVKMNPRWGDFIKHAVIFRGRSEGVSVDGRQLVYSEVEYGKGGAAYFGGGAAHQNEAVEMPSAARPTGEFVGVFRFEVPSTTNQRYFFGNSDSSDNTDLSIAYHDTDHIRFYRGGVFINIDPTTTTMTAGDMVNLAVCVSGTTSDWTYRISINGGPVDSTTDTNNTVDTTSGNVTLGRFGHAWGVDLHYSNHMDFAAWGYKPVSDRELISLSRNPYFEVLEPANDFAYFTPAAAPPVGGYSAVIERYYRTLLSGH